MRTGVTTSVIAASLLVALGCSNNGSDAATSTGPSEAATSTASSGADGSERAGASAGSGRGGVRLARIGTFDAPVYVTQPPGVRRLLFVVEKTGRIRVVRGGRKLRRPFLDLSGEVTNGSEQGLLSMAFAPDYGRSRRFYVNFTDRNGDTRVQEFRRSKRSPTRADRSTRRQVLFVDQPYANHNGGLVLFGPDGLLYIGMGDGGSGGDPHGNGQKLSTLLGKLLRIDPRRSGGRPYRVPSANPFVRRAGARDEIYSYGLRNPWRFSFDRATGALSIGDVGQNSVEEIDYVRRGRGKGANFGWNAFEGRERFDRDASAPGHVPPIHTYGRDGGACSVTGGYVVRDRALSTLYGRYLYGDFCKGELRSFVPSTSGARGDRALGPTVSQLSSFGEDRRRRVYATSLDGPVYRLARR